MSSINIQCQDSKVYANLMINYQLEKAWKLHLNKFMVIMFKITSYDTCFVFKKSNKTIKVLRYKLFLSQYWQIVGHICNWNIQENSLDWINFATGTYMYKRSQVNLLPASLSCKALIKPLFYFRSQTEHKIMNWKLKYLQHMAFKHTCSWLQ